MIRIDKKRAILLITVFLFVSFAFLCGHAAGTSDVSYDVYVKTVDGWALQEQLHLSKYYETVSIDLSGVLPDSDGEYKVRITQQGGIAAHVDYVALSDGTPIAPTSATCIDDRSDILRKVVSLDNDVADAWGKTIECTWENSVSSPVLVVNANIEHYTIEAPIRTPCVMTPELMLPYVITNNGVITVDGVPDSLGAPDFSDYWEPDSGHPYGYTYLWLRCDGDYLYAIMEITSDNTYDDTGWGSLYVSVDIDNEMTEFRVDAASHRYGVDGFVYTDTVPWQHMVYEFKIPLSEIGAGAGDSIKIGYGGYGTEYVIIEVEKWVHDGDQWVKELTAQINDTLRFKLVIDYDAMGDDVFEYFSDVLDCSLLFAGNVTVEPTSELPELIDSGPYTFKPIVLHPHNLSWNPYNPFIGPDGDNFTALCPDVGNVYRVEEGSDVNMDYRVSVDDLLLLNSTSGSSAAYRVDNVPYTLNVTNTETEESMYIDSVRDFEAVYLDTPNGSTWLEVCCCKDRYNLSAWNDTNVTGDLNVNDTITLQNLRTGQEATYRVNEVTIDLVVSRVLPLGPGTGKWSIEYNAQVIRCGIDNNTLRAFAWYPDFYDLYDASDVVTITVPCGALEVDKTVWNGTAWVKELDAKINDTIQFKSTITNTGYFNLTQIRFWDILDCSLNYSGNATLTNASGVVTDIELNDDLKPKVLGPANSSWNLSVPEGELFFQLCPEILERTVVRWEDTDGDNNVSACDQILLNDSESEYWYHVDRVSIILGLNGTNGNLSSIFYSVLDWDEFSSIDDLINSTWLELLEGIEEDYDCKDCKEQYTCTNWNSSNGTITMRNDRTLEEVQYTIMGGGLGLVVSREFGIDNLLDDTFILEPNQTITIEYDATVVKCGVDNNTFRAKGWHSLPAMKDVHTWYYSNEDKVTITVPCFLPSGNATDPSGLVQEVYITTEDVYGTGYGFPPNKTVDIYIVDVQPLVDGQPIPTPIYAKQLGVMTDDNGTVGPVKVWEKPTEPGLYLMIFDDDQGTWYQFEDASDLFEIRRLAVPLLTPLGLIALVSLLSAIAAVTLVRKRR